MKSPIVGFTLDHEEGGKPGNYSKLPHYALRENYCTSVSELGGVALPLPHDVAAVPRYLEMIDALVTTGGAFDIPPAMYGVSDVHQTVTTKDTRTQFEWAMMEGALKKNIPILGVCGGMQLLNVVLGGTLIQHIPDAIEGALAHEQPNPRNEPGHKIKVQKGSLLHHIVGEEEISVNSAHHQAVDKPALGAIISATAPDGVIEAIEFPKYRFCLGVQWHPEYHVTEADDKIWEAFLKA